MFKKAFRMLGLMALLGVGLVARAAQPLMGERSPEVSFGGQYRINSYTVENDSGGDRQTASRLRIRQNIDLDFQEGLKTHLQLELGHTTDNLTTTNNSSRMTGIAVRHAVLDYTFPNGLNAQAGIVPLSDYFGDTLFSSGWDYNPVALSLNVPLGSGTFRVFAGNLAEGKEGVAEDDFVHYQLDYRVPLPGKNEVNIGATVAETADPAGSDHLYAGYGVGGRFQLRDGFTFTGFVVGSHTDKALLGTPMDARGIAVKLEFSGEAGPGRFGLLTTYAGGEADGSGFLPLEALAKTNGYWGYTGLLTVQGPTDTGFDGDSVNLSNNGFGLITFQARYLLPVTRRLHSYLAVGWFGQSDPPAGRSDRVGTDFLAMGTYRFNRVLALDFGFAYARLKDALSGYSNGVIGGAVFNQAAGVSRDKNAFFSRLQAEF